MARSRLEVADIFRDHGPAWREANRGHISLEQLKVMSAIESCRTAALGGHVARCENEGCAHTVGGSSLINDMALASHRPCKQATWSELGSQADRLVPDLLRRGLQQLRLVARARRAELEYRILSEFSAVEATSPPAQVLGRYE